MAKGKLAITTIILSLLVIISNPLKPLFPYKRDNPKSVFRVFLQMDRLSFEDNETVNLNMCIKNNSKRNKSFKVYDFGYTTFQPVVYDISGREAEIIVSYRLMNRDITDVVKRCKYRVIELSPDETIIHSVNLKNIYNLKIGVEYRVRGFFSPDVKSLQAIPSENQLTFKIVKSRGFVKKSGIERMSRSISPSEIVLLVLTAEKNRDWDNFYKYIKLESYINAFSNYVRIYNEADGKKRLKIIDDFIKFLSRRRSDYIVNFKILEESVLKERNIAYVDAEVTRFGPKKPFVYTYKYTLERFRNFWLIIDVEAIVRKVKRS